jgi:REP element-mobilizing transposase RayT
MTKPNHTLPQRKIIHLQDFDYAQNGAYFITMVTHKRVCLFGTVNHDKMVLNDAGKMLETVLLEIPGFIPGLEIDLFQIMPNHVHAIITIGPFIESGQPNVAQLNIPNPTGNANPSSLFDIVRRFKTLTTRRYIVGVRDYGWPRFDKHLWQRSFYEHVIRNEREYEAIVYYIYANPMNWEKDKEYR